MIKNTMDSLAQSKGEIYKKLISAVNYFGFNGHSVNFWLCIKYKNYHGIVVIDCILGQ